MSICVPFRWLLRDEKSLKLESLSSRRSFFVHKYPHYSMKHADEESAQKLTVRRLFLTRGKLKASSRTSALMSGFAMVIITFILLFRPSFVMGWFLLGWKNLLVCAKPVKINKSTSSSCRVELFLFVLPPGQFDVNKRLSFRWRWRN